jgi:hypothetical protein
MVCYLFPRLSDPMQGPRPDQTNIDPFSVNGSLDNLMSATDELFLFYGNRSNG